MKPYALWWERTAGLTPPPARLKIPTGTLAIITLFVCSYLHPSHSKLQLIIQKTSVSNSSLRRSEVLIAKGDQVRHLNKPSCGIGKVVKIVQCGNLLVKFHQARISFSIQNTRGWSRSRMTSLCSLRSGAPGSKKGAPSRLSGPSR